jgi:hypothetical protein
MFAATHEECDTCETIIAYLELLVEQNSSVEFLEDALTRSCNFLPDSMKAKVTRETEGWWAFLTHSFCEIV